MWAAIKTALALAWRYALQWINGADGNARLLRERELELADARSRISALETALAKERAERLRRLRDIAANVVDSTGADELLGDVTRGAGNAN